MTLPRITLVLLALVAASLLVRALGDTSGLLVASSVLMFACCASSAVHVLGARAALRFVLIAVVLGWTAEQLGSTYGWFFGS
jgi:putative membrane protein